MIDKEAVRKDRAAGMRYADIAEKHGCSEQYIGLICRGYNPKSFHFVSQDGCIYPNWRRWMNENRVSHAAEASGAAGAQADQLQDHLRVLPAETVWRDI